MSNIGHYFAMFVNNVAVKGCEFGTYRSQFRLQYSMLFCGYNKLCYTRSTCTRKMVENGFCYRCSQWYLKKRFPSPPYTYTIGSLPWYTIYLPVGLHTQVWKMIPCVFIYISLHNSAIHCYQIHNTYFTACPFTEAATVQRTSICKSLSWLIACHRFLITRILIQFADIKQTARPWKEEV